MSRGKHFSKEEIEFIKVNALVKSTSVFITIEQPKLIRNIRV